MKFIQIFCRLSVVPLLLLANLAGAQEIEIKHQGLTLNAKLELPADRSLADGVILITHGALAHRDMEIMRYLRQLLNEQGYSSLAINLSLGLDNRRGMLDCADTHRHRNEDAVDEIAAWMDWLKRQGAGRVVLLGHSRGGGQTALYAAERDSDQLQAVVLLAPAVGANSDAADYKKRHQQELAPVLARARELVEAGRGDTVLQHVNMLYCHDTSVTATSFASYYGGDTRLDTPSLLPKINKPTLVVVAGADEVVVGLDNRIAPLTDGRRLRMVVIEGSDHLFRDLNAEEAVDALVTFLEEVR